MVQILNLVLSISIYFRSLSSLHMDFNHKVIYSVARYEVKPTQVYELNTQVYEKFVSRCTVYMSYRSVHYRYMYFTRAVH